MKTRIYTDGACSGNPGPGGWAAVILFENEKQQISGFEKDTTNNRMELRAVVESLRIVFQLQCKKIEVHSDSAYVVNSVKNKWLKKWSENGWKTIQGKDVKNKDLWLALLDLLNNKNKQINFVKVKGHSGDKHNEMVDQLAKREVDKVRNKQS